MSALGSSYSGNSQSLTLEHDNIPWGQQIVQKNQDAIHNNLDALSNLFTVFFGNSNSTLPSTMLTRSRKSDEIQLFKAQLASIDMVIVD